MFQLQHPLTQQSIKEISLLHQKKQRDIMGCFLAEGVKLVQDFLRGGLVCQGLLYTTPLVEAQLRTWLPKDSRFLLIPIEAKVMSRISSLTTPCEVVGLFTLPLLQSPFSLPIGWGLVLDGVQNPGNLGSLIRSADWFGFRDIYCGPGTADAYSPKGVQATMGALARVRLGYGELGGLLTRAREEGLPVIGADLGGMNLQDLNHAIGQVGNEGPSRGLVVMGNEGSGLSPLVKELLSHRVTIPLWHHAGEPSESLNVGAAASVFLWELTRLRFARNELPESKL